MDMDLIPANANPPCTGALMNNPYKPLWLFTDIEMTSLNMYDPYFGVLEVAMIITDVDLKVVDSLHVVIFQPEEVLQTASSFCKKTFCARQYGGNGLFTFCRQVRTFNYLLQDCLFYFDAFAYPILLLFNM